MDEGFYLSRNFGIRVNFDVRLHEETVVPGILLAIDRSRFIVEAEIPDNVRACRIGGANPGLAVHKAIRLIEICGLGYVGGNHPIVLAPLGNTVHLNAKQHRKSFSSHFTRPPNGRRSSTPMPLYGAT